MCAGSPFQDLLYLFVDARILQRGNKYLASFASLIEMGVEYRVDCTILNNGLAERKTGKKLPECNGSLSPLLQSLPDPDAAAESWPAAASPECVQSR